MFQISRIFRRLFLVYGFFDRQRVRFFPSLFLLIFLRRKQGEPGALYTYDVIGIIVH